MARDSQLFRDAFHVHPSKTVCNGTVQHHHPQLDMLFIAIFII